MGDIVFECGMGQYNMTQDHRVFEPYWACVNEYMDMMLSLGNEGIDIIEDNGWEYYKMPVRFNQRMQSRNLSFDHIHYGFKLPFEKWEQRKQYCPEMPFITLQRFFQQKGYTLLDESDPTKSKQTRITLYKGNKYNNEQLWHNFNNLPN